MAHEATPLLPISATQAQTPLGTGGWTSWKRGVISLMCVSLIILVAFHISSAPKPTPNILHPHPRRSTSPHVLNFLVVGDWGRDGLYNQSQVASQMGEVGDNLGIDFVVSVGDNFYESGLTGVDDPYFTSSFTNIYNASSLQTTWYAVLGNHDYRGDALSQLSDYLVQRDARWFCRRDFQLNMSLCNSSSAASCNATVGLFFVDTTPFIDDYWQSTTQAYDWRGLAPQEEQVAAQLQDLGLKLQASNATWKIVLGHHTIRSIGWHGDMSELVDQLLPVLEEYKVDMYINGHDHNLQHIKRADSLVHFFTSGGGSKSYKGLRTYDDDDGVQFARDGQGFLSVSMSESSASLIFYDVFGEAVYNYSFQK